MFTTSFPKIFVAVKYLNNYGPLNIEANIHARLYYVKCPLFMFDFDQNFHVSRDCDKTRRHRIS